MIRRLLVVLTLLVCLGAPPLSAMGSSKGTRHKGASNTTAKSGDSSKTFEMA